MIPAETEETLIRRRRESRMKVAMVLFTAVVFFSYGSWKLIVENMYTHVTIERYHQDNENITEAFKEKAALNRHLEKELSEQRILVEVQEEKLAAKEKELEKTNSEKWKAETNYSLLQKKLQKTQNEKDSLIAVIRSLRRVE